MARINFVAEQVGNLSLPGVHAMIERLKAMGVLSPDQLVDRCLDLLGPVEVNPDTRRELTEQAHEWGKLSWDSDAHAQLAAKRATEMMQLIVATGNISSPET